MSGHELEPAAPEAAPAFAPAAPVSGSSLGPIGPGLLAAELARERRVAQLQVVEFDARESVSPWGNASAPPAGPRAVRLSPASSGRVATDETAWAVAVVIGAVDHDRPWLMVRKTITLTRARSATDDRFDQVVSRY